MNLFLLAMTTMAIMTSSIIRLSMTAVHRQRFNLFNSLAKNDDEKRRTKVLKFTSISDAETLESLGDAVGSSLNVVIIIYNIDNNYNYNNFRETCYYCLATLAQV